MKIGVLALQGAFAEHQQMLARCGVEAPQVRLPEQLAELDGLILPGGESTTIGKLLRRYGFVQPLQSFAREGKGLWGTCAGMIVLAREVVDGLPDQLHLDLLDLRVTRNAFGRQVDSFQTPLELPILGSEPFPAVFIRAPLAQPLGEVEVLASYQGQVVAARQGSVMATSFHPELSPDPRLHQWFCQQCARATACC